MTLMMPSDSVQAALRDLIRRFQRARTSEPGPVAEILMGRVLRCRRLEIHLHASEALTAAQNKELERLAQRALCGEPVQYVLGETEFMGHVFRVDRRALIPRPETELLVETALADSELWKRDKPAVADVGTGSGCIVISLALARSSTAYTAFDASAEALELAQENAAALGVKRRIRFARNDLLSGVPGNSLDAVVSNPPYVAVGEWERLPRHIRDCEPRLALDGGDDGFAVVSRLVPEAWQALKPGGRLFMEIGEDQKAGTEARMKSAGFKKIRVLKDLAKHDRIAVGEKP